MGVCYSSEAKVFRKLKSELNELNDDFDGRNFVASDSGHKGDPLEYELFSIYHSSRRSRHSRPFGIPMSEGTSTVVSWKKIRHLFLSSKELQTARRKMLKIAREDETLLKFLNTTDFPIRVILVARTDEGKERSVECIAFPDRVLSLSIPIIFLNRIVEVHYIQGREHILEKYQSVNIESVSSSAMIEYRNLHDDAMLGNEIHVRRKIREEWKSFPSCEFVASNGEILIDPKLLQGLSPEE